MKKTFKTPEVEIIMLKDDIVTNSTCPSFVCDEFDGYECSVRDGEYCCQGDWGN